MREIICIEGHRFDTTKAKAHYELRWVDDRSNVHKGELYLSKKGTWYVYTPSQWSNMHHWEITSAEEALEAYDQYLEDEEKKEIIELAKLETE